MSQTEDQLPFATIPDYPSAYTPETVAARMIDGLGFRYYWASEGLEADDLSYKGSESSRTTYETMEHIYQLAFLVYQCTVAEPISDRPKGQSYGQMREGTLNYLKLASDRLKSGDYSLEDMKLIFVRDESTSQFPFWNNINGPISDALWHTGQVVYNRRASGNPIRPGVSVLTGTVKGQ